VDNVEPGPFGLNGVSWRLAALGRWARRLGAAGRPGVASASTGAETLTAVCWRSEVAAIGLRPAPVAVRVILSDLASLVRYLRSLHHPAPH
jgi:hypothetical protein